MRLFGVVSLRRGRLLQADPSRWDTRWFDCVWIVKQMGHSLVRLRVDCGTLAGGDDVLDDVRGSCGVFVRGHASMCRSFITDFDVRGILIADGLYSKTAKRHR